MNNIYDFLEKNYTCVNGGNLWQRQGQRNFIYSDEDDVEERIAEIIRTSLDRSSMSCELKQSITDWPSNYHLNPRRANLLRPLRSVLKGSILEIGAGTGAITRFLGENGAQVVAVEGSARRAAIAADRCADLSQVAIVADDFADFPSGPTFDVVTLIGVLEYAHVFFRHHDGDPVSALISRACSFLRPGGRLVVAIENQLGLKYLPGCADDHIRQPMVGVEDVYGIDAPVTFGRVELSRRLADCGLPHQRWWFPFPDYKLPVSLISDETLRHNVDLSALSSETVRDDPQLSGPLAFSLERAWKPVFRNGLLADLANSFLVVSSDSALPDHNVLAVHYGDVRRPEFAKEVSFQWRDGSVCVTRARLNPGLPDATTGLVSLHLSDEPYLPLPSWQAKFVSLTTREGWTLDEWVVWARGWLNEALCVAGYGDGHIPPPQTILPGRLMDATPRNLGFESTGRPRFFGQEWRLVEPLELGFLVYRAIFDSLDSLRECAQPAPGVSLSRLSLFQHFIRSLGWVLSHDDVQRYLQLENRIHATVSASTARSFRSLSDAIPVQVFRKELQLHTVQALQQQLVHAQMQIAHATAARENAERDAAQTKGMLEASARNLQAATEQLAQNARRFQEISGVGDRLVGDLRRAYSKPWYPLRQFLLRAGFRTALIFKRVLPDELSRRFNHSLGIRHPTRFQSLWDQVRIYSDNGHANSQNERENAWIETSGYFDPDWYEGSREAVELGLTAVQHYLSIGERRGLAPSPKFDPVFYRRCYPEVAEGQLRHFLSAGWSEGRLPAPFIRDNPNSPCAMDAGKRTVFVLVHDASRTDAPILAWNIVRILRRKYNVVAVLQHGGSIESWFEEAANTVVKISDRFRGAFLEYEALAEALTKEFKPKYVIANSVETRGFVHAFERNGVPVIALAHEFSSYYRPAGDLHELLKYAWHVVFPARVVADGFLEDYHGNLPRRFSVLPQGASEGPADPSQAETNLATAYSQRPLGELLGKGRDHDALSDRNGTVFVVGMGTVCLRKGADLFVSVAAEVVRRRPDLKIEFAWAGDMIDAVKEYKELLESQVKHSGLSGHFRFLGVLSDLEPLYARADVMLLTSRLDPLPNDAINCAVRGIPVVCFESASGMSEVLLQHHETTKLVAPYLDVHTMAEQVIELATDQHLRQRMANAMQEIGLKSFQMPHYVECIDALAPDADVIRRQIARDYEVINAAGVFNATLNQHVDAEQVDDQIALKNYLSASRRAIPRAAPWGGEFVRRPLEGFNPLIYVSENQAFDETSGEDPLAHYIRTGRPAGAWAHRVITPGTHNISKTTGLRIAIHGHFHYTELFPEFLRRLGRNQQSYDLFITTTSDEGRMQIEDMLSGSGVTRATVIPVPNRGRDIGPMLSAFPGGELFSYDILGHFHSKRSLHAGGSMGEIWRTFLWEHLIGDEYPMLDEIVTAFASDEKLGLVFPEDPNLFDWSRNWEVAEQLASRLGVTLPRQIEFPIGTMFWARPAALKPLLDLNLMWDDYPAEPLPIDGTLLHVLERMLPLVADKAGFHYATTHVREHRR